MEKEKLIMKYGNPKNWNDKNLYLKWLKKEEFDSDFLNIVKEQIDKRGGIEKLKKNYEEEEIVNKAKLDKKLTLNRRKKKYIKIAITVSLIVFFCFLIILSKKGKLNIDFFQPKILVTYNFNSSHNTVYTELARELTYFTLYHKLDKKYNVINLKENESVRSNSLLYSLQIDYFVWLSQYKTSVQMEYELTNEKTEMKNTGKKTVNYRLPSEITKIAETHECDSIYDILGVNDK